MRFSIITLVAPLLLAGRFVWPPPSRQSSSLLMLKHSFKRNGRLQLQVPGRQWTIQRCHTALLLIWRCIWYRLSRWSSPSGSFSSAFSFLLTSSIATILTFHSAPTPITDSIAGSLWNVVLARAMAVLSVGRKYIVAKTIAIVFYMFFGLRGTAELYHYMYMYVWGFIFAF